MVGIQKKPNPVDTYVGLRVRLRRSMLGMSQGKLGESLGVSFQQIQKYEKGSNRIGASRLQRLSEVLDVPVAFFFEDASGEVYGEIAAHDGPDQIVQFLATPDGLQLNRAFVQIADPKIRRHLVNLVRALADTAEGPVAEAEA